MNYKNIKKNITMLQQKKNVLKLEKILTQKLKELLI